MKVSWDGKEAFMWNLHSLLKPILVASRGHPPR